jgi:hypothetical protein
MKLTLQIAAGIILAWLTISVIQMLAAAYALNSFTESLPRFPAVSSPQSTSPPKVLPPTVIREAAPQTNGKQWSIQTPNGTTYSGTGRPPDGGVGQPSGNEEERLVR